MTRINLNTVDTTHGQKHSHGGQNRTVSRWRFIAESTTGGGLRDNRGRLLSTATDRLSEEVKAVSPVAFKSFVSSLRFNLHMSINGPARRFIDGEDIYQEAVLAVLSNDNPDLSDTIAADRAIGRARGFAERRASKVIDEQDIEYEHEPNQVRDSRRLIAECAVDLWKSLTDSRRRTVKRYLQSIEGMGGQGYTLSMDDIIKALQACEGFPRI